MLHPASPPEDLVVLLDENRSPIGAAPRDGVHTASTALHLAFSCYVFGPDGMLLLTRRALTKRTWPGVWTNSLCGHPRPGEPMDLAIARRARHELGLTLSDVVVVLPDFAYRATDASGVVENEICPVHVAVTSDQPVPNPSEVMEVRWVDTQHLGRSIAATPWVFSPWMVDQVLALAELAPITAPAER